MTVVADHRPITYIEHDHDGIPVVVYRASAIGSCRTALIASRLGYEPGGTPRDVADLAARGNELEPLAIQWLEEQMDCAVVDRQRTVEKEGVLPSGQRFLLRGHIDGLVLARGMVRSRAGLMEAKGRNPKVFDDLVERGEAAVWESHRWQFSGYCHAEELPMCYYVAACRERGIFHLVECYDLVPWEAICEKVASVENAVLFGELPTCHGDGPGWCSYWNLHTRRPHEAAEDLAEVLPLYGAAAEQARNGKATCDALRPQLLEALGERNRVAAAGWVLERSKRGALTVRPLGEKDEVTT